MVALRLLLLVSLQTALGFGLLRLFRQRSSGSESAALAILLGLPASSFLVFWLDVAEIRIDYLSVIAVIGAAATLLLAPTIGRRGLRPARIGSVTDRTATAAAVHPAEAPFLVVIAVLVLLSAWRCWYLPATTRDACVGMDLVAKYAVQDGTLRSSVFHDAFLRPYLSLQPFYAPFTALMQVLYRLTGLAFGKLWLTLLLVAFLVFLYRRLRESLHPCLASAVCLLFLAVPEMYAASYLVLTDWNAVLGNERDSLPAGVGDAADTRPPAFGSVLRIRVLGPARRPSSSSWSARSWRVGRPTAASRSSGPRRSWRFRSPSLRFGTGSTYRTSFRFSQAPLCPRIRTGS